MPLGTLEQIKKPLIGQPIRDKEGSFENAIVETDPVSLRENKDGRAKIH